MLKLAVIGAKLFFWFGDGFAGFNGGRAGDSTYDSVSVYWLTGLSLAPNVHKIMSMPCLI